MPPLRGVYSKHHFISKPYFITIRREMERREEGAIFGMNKPRLSFWQIWNMSFGFLGIQFGWALQLGNMSAIYERLGAKPEDIPILWLAAPLTGLIVQPIIGLRATFAGWLPLLFAKYGVTASTASRIPLTVKYAFQLGAVAFLVAVIYTVVTSKEYPPEDLEAFRRKKQEKQGIAAGFNEI